MRDAEPEAWRQAAAQQVPGTSPFESAAPCDLALQVQAEQAVCDMQPVNQLLEWKPLLKKMLHCLDTSWPVNCALLAAASKSLFLQILGSAGRAV